MTMTMTIMNSENIFVKRWLIEVLTWLNFLLWFSCMKQWLMSEELWYTVENQISADSTLNSDIFFSLHSLDFRNQKINVKVLYWLNMCISVENQKLLMNKITAREIWQVLKIKYEQRLLITGRQYLADFTAYKMSSNKSINEIWTHLTKLDRKITTTQSDLSSLNMLEQHFQALLHELSEKYCTICDGIESWLTIVNEGIVILHKK